MWGGYHSAETEWALLFSKELLNNLLYFFRESCGYFSAFQNPDYCSLNNNVNYALWIMKNCCLLGSSEAVWKAVSNKQTSTCIFPVFSCSFLCKRAPCWRWFEKYQTQPSGRIGIMVKITWQSIYRKFHLGNFLTICLSQAGGKSALLWKKLGKPPHTWNIFNIILFIIIIMLVCWLFCMHL